MTLIDKIWKQINLLGYNVWFGRMCQSNLGITFEHKFNTTVPVLVLVDFATVRQEMSLFVLTSRRFGWLKKNYTVDIAGVRCTYGSCMRGDILRMVSRNLWSPHQILGFWGWLLTFSILKRIHKMTAIAANRAVDMMAKERPSWASRTNTSSDQNFNRYWIMWWKRACCRRFYSPSTGENLFCDEIICRSLLCCAHARLCRDNVKRQSRHLFRCCRQEWHRSGSEPQQSREFFSDFGHCGFTVLVNAI